MQADNNVLLEYFQCQPGVLSVSPVPAAFRAFRERAEGGKAHVCQGQRTC